TGAHLRDGAPWGLSRRVERRHVDPHRPFVVAVERVAGGGGGAVARWLAAVVGGGDVPTTSARFRALPAGGKPLGYDARMVGVGRRLGRGVDDDATQATERRPPSRFPSPQSLNYTPNARAIPAR